MELYYNIDYMFLIIHIKYSQSTNASWSEKKIVSNIKAVIEYSVICLAS